MLARYTYLGDKTIVLTELLHQRCHFDCLWARTKYDENFFHFPTSSLKKKFHKIQAIKSHCSLNEEHIHKRTLNYFVLLY
ncbi:Uncharacterised protein [Vibrio cholerae]|nr:Uncharacterised protein [Vibrio cholerae]CSC82705.1 Uncharacterised protein [Vibrio cholerae]CSC90606.1 Uncharacterised protein [Vibrio cholerae]